MHRCTGNTEQCLMLCGLYSVPYYASSLKFSQDFATSMSLRTEPDKNFLEVTTTRYIIKAFCSIESVGEHRGFFRLVGIASKLILRSHYADGGGIELCGYLLKARGTSSDRAMKTGQWSMNVSAAPCECFFISSDNPQTQRV